MTSIITFTDIAEIAILAYVAGFITPFTIIVIFGKKKPKGGLVDCTCDVGATPQVVTGANCAYHRRGCPARAHWDKTRNG